MCATAYGIVIESGTGGTGTSVIRGVGSNRCLEVPDSATTDGVQTAGLAPVGNIVGMIDVRKNSLTTYDAAGLAVARPRGRLLLGRLATAGGKPDSHNCRDRGDE